jgi:hypothetical protein
MLLEKIFKSHVLRKIKIKAQIYRDQNGPPVVSFSKTYGTDQLYSLSLKSAHIYLNLWSISKW